MEPLRMPWADALEDYRCFGCSPQNPHGLRLTFTAHEDGLETRYRLDRGHESYPGLVHGGITGLVCDETMGNLIALRLGISAYTTSMRLRYLAPALVDEEYVCRASWRGEPDADVLLLAADVFDAHGTAVAGATAAYRPFDRTHLSLAPGDAARLDEALSSQEYRL